MADLDNHKQNLKDLAQTRKIKQSDEFGGAGTVETNYTELKPKTAKEKFDNFWYHYRVIVLILFIIVIFLVNSYVQFLNPTIYDGGLAFVTETPFDSNSLFVEQEWKKLCDDSNDDGEINLQVITAQLDVYNKYNMDPTLAEANVTKFMGNLAVMGNMLYVVDEVGYNVLLESGVILADLSSLVDSSLLTDGVDKYLLKGTNLSQMVGIGNVLEDMYLCLISYDDFPDSRKKDEEIQKIWEDDVNFFKNLVAYG